MANGREGCHSMNALTEGLVDIVSDSSGHEMSATNVTVRLYKCGMICNPHNDGCMDGVC